MCGITGYIYKDPIECADESMLKKMCDVIRHRGPDEWGRYENGPVGIGMRRLSIIDLASGTQPIHNEDSTIWIVFNGEIYNHKDLRADLEKRGHKFYTNSDTETIVHLYEQYGENCVDRLRGMFAFAIWDGNAETLFLARDRLGIKPLHYYDDGKKFIFGSEIKSVLAAADIHTEVRMPSIVNYLAYGYVPDPDTMFEGIKKLPPGYVLVYRKGTIRLKQYWDVEFNYGKLQPEEFYIERILELLNEAVRIRLMSEVPLGAFLSGGTDSGMVVALMARNMAEPVKTFSIGFEHQKYNELPFARMVADRYGTDHHEEIVKPDAQAVINDLVRQFDEPFADSSAIPTYYVSRMTRKRVTVSLSGDGGDEVFAGYGRYRDGPPAKYTRWIPATIRKPLFHTASRFLPDWFPTVRTLQYAGYDDDNRYIWKMVKGLNANHDRVFSRDFRRSVETTDPSYASRKYFEKVRHLETVSRRQYLDFKTYLPGDILTKVDRTSMMVSLEARVPILDHKLVEFAATIPPVVLFNGQNPKHLFKKVAERLLPREAVYRPKMGFAVPVAHWINNEWKDLSQELLLGGRAQKRNIFNRNFVKRVMNEHRSGRRPHDNTIWALMVLEIWFREFIDEQIST